VRSVEPSPRGRAGARVSDFWLLIAAGSLAAFLVGLSKGGLALIGAIGVPILALVVSPVRAAAVLLPVYVLSDMTGLWVYRREFSRENLTILMPSAVAGIAIGWATASYVSDRGVGLLVGLIGVGFCLNSWRTRHLQPVPRPADLKRGIAWGTITGFASFVSHAGSPAYQVYVLPQRLPKMVYAGTTAILFAFMNVLKLIPYWALGQLSAENLRVALYLALPALAGTLLGVRLVRILPTKSYFAVVQVLLLAVSLRLILKAVGI
jgi:uncharacterized membrane protein YfcA